ncbi:Uncharacterised protein [Vibrio cholerae]|nr:Uncharacterised protein [Vibrio cholerae]CSI59454.1 Uncharacterised protein [Vibrio cholerae]
MRASCRASPSNPFHRGNLRLAKPAMLVHVHLNQRRKSRLFQSRVRSPIV